MPSNALTPEQRRLKMIELVQERMQSAGVSYGAAWAQMEALHPDLFPAKKAPASPVQIIRHPETGFAY